MAKVVTVRARATIHHGHPNGTVQVVQRGETIELDLAEGERLHKARLADIEGEPSEKIEAPPPLQNSKGKKSSDLLGAGNGDEGKGGEGAGDGAGGDQK